MNHVICVLSHSEPPSLSAMETEQNTQNKQRRSYVWSVLFSPVYRVSAVSNMMLFFRSNQNLTKTTSFNHTICTVCSFEAYAFGSIRLLSHLDVVDFREEKARKDYLNFVGFLPTPWILDRMVESGLDDSGRGLALRGGCGCAGRLHMLAAPLNFQIPHRFDC
eukprot:1779096-Amphidinium_carterae.1